MDRVEEVVNYGLDNDMYVIVNVHHNDLQHNVPNTDAISAELTAIWDQIGNRFKDYGDKLIFEVNNEPRCEGDWTGTADYYESVNRCNEAARIAIRATGGNNTDRLVMLPTYCASGDYEKAAAWTKNADDDMIAVSIHAYLPFDFAFEGTVHTEWTDTDFTELSAFFNRMETLFLSKDIPVVIGEFGACNKNNTSDREKYAGIYGGLARQFAQQDIPCVWWDNNCFSTGKENFGIYNRSQRSFTYGGIADAIIGAYDGNPACEEYTTGEELLSAGGSCDTWGQAVNFDAGTIVSLGEDDTIYCNYTSNSAPEFILRSETNSDKAWVRIEPDSCANGVAQWNYSTLLRKFGGDFSDLSRGYIGAKDSYLTVTKVYIPRGLAHTHIYNGTENITIPATDTTKGRKTIGCSVSGCTAYKIEVLEKKPTNVKATPGNGKVTLTWDAVDGATGYRILMNGGSGWKGTNVGNVTTYTATGLTNGTTYKFVVKSIVGGAYSADSADSAQVTATPKAVTATPPANVKAAAGDSKVTLTWSAVTGATGYRILMNGGSGWKGTNVGNVTTYTATGLTNGTTYKFVVKSIVGGAYSADSTQVTATPKAAATATPPTNVKAAAGDSKVTLTWSAVTGATGYRILMNCGSGCKGTNVGNVTTYTATGLTNGTTYKFVVKSIVGGAYSADSTQVVAAPMAITASVTDTTATMSWTAVTGATGYRILVNDGSGWKGTNVTGTTYKATGLTVGKAYRYIVKAILNGAYTSDSVTTYITPMTITKSLTDTTLTLNWSAVTGASGYRVLCNDGSGWTGVNVATNSYTKTLTPGKTYKFVLKSIIGGTYSADVVYSSTVTIYA